MPKIKMIYNPRADRGRVTELYQKIHTHAQVQVERAAEAGNEYELDWVETEAPLHATALVQEAAQQGFDIVVAIGGDGTVHEVVNGILALPSEQQPLLGILPVGSGNDFAFNVGLPVKMEDAVACLFSDTTRSVDGGHIRDGDGRHEYWNNTVGVGFSGAVNIAARKVTWARGFLIYLVSVLETIFINPVKLGGTFQINDDAPFEGRFTMLSICNGPREGGGFPVVPEAVMDDGLISYGILRQVGRITMLFLLPIVMMAQHMRFKRFFSQGTATHMKITTDEPLAIHIDGELFAHPEIDHVQEFEVEIMPQALQVLCCE